MSISVLSKAIAGVQLETIDACPICSSVNCDPLYKTHDWLHRLPGEFGLSKCNECSVNYLSERPTAQSIGFYYPDDAYYSYKRPVAYSLFWRRDVISSAWYFVKKSILAHQYGYKHVGGSKLISALSRLPFMRGLHNRAIFQLDSLLHPYVENGSLLEVGCGSGMYLDLMRALGWKRVAGVDISAKAIRQAKDELSIEAYCGDLRNVEFESATFDAVSLSHTLEHMYDPVAFLSEVRRVMKPGGRLAIIVPNLESLSSRRLGEYWFHVDAPRHTVNFTRKGLSTLLKKAGFTIEKMATIPRGAYHTAHISYNRKAGVDASSFANDKYRLRALLLFLMEHAQCAVGLPAGEELTAVAVKPN